MNRDTEAIITREEARLAGGLVYTAAPVCKRGHAEGRYTSSGHCLGCTREGAVIRAKKLSAELNGAKTFVGSPCKKCGSTLRRVSNRNCASCNRENARAREAKNLQEKNGEIIYSGIPCDRCGGISRYSRSNLCVACEKRTAKEWQINNYIQHRAKAHLWDVVNAEKRRITSRESARRHPLRVIANQQNRRARKINAEGHHTKHDIANIFKMQRGRCAYCRKPLGEKFHTDHIIALSKGGTNWPRNLQLLHPVCNRKKHAKDPIDYAREIGLLI